MALLTRVAALGILVLLVSNTFAMAAAALLASILLLAVRPPTFWFAWGVLATGAAAVRLLLLQGSYDAWGATLLWLAAAAVVSFGCAWRTARNVDETS